MPIALTTPGGINDKYVDGRKGIIVLLLMLEPAQGAYSAAAQGDHTADVAGDARGAVLPKVLAVLALLYEE